MSVFLLWRESFITTGKKSSIYFVVSVKEKKKIQSSVWRVVLLCQFLVLAGNWQFFLLWREIFITTVKKKDTVVCLAGARSLLRPEKKSSSRLSGGCAIDITTGKKSSSRLSGECAIVITTGKKRF